MTHTELIEEVYSWTKRPDMVAQTASAVRSATLKYHRKENFWRDLAAVNIPGLTPATVQLIDIATYLPRFRKVAAVWVPATATQIETYLEVVMADDLFLPDGGVAYAKDNIAFFAGTQLNIKSSTQPTELNVMYWRDPVVTPAENYSSWIADTQPDLIITAAARIVLTFDNESEIYRVAAAEELQQWTTLLQNNVEVLGH